MVSLLVVDDELGTLRSVYRVLKMKNYDVSAAHSVQEALETVEMLQGSVDKLDIVVTDIQMPEGTGMDLLKSLKDSHPDLPVVIITGFGSPEIEEEFREAGCSDFIHKPFRAEELIESINNVLDL